MPDDDRTRRRLGDETKGRIADLASGWDVEDDATDTPAKAIAPRPAPVTPRPVVKTPTPTPVVAAKAPRGDETNARIAEISTGWSLDSRDAPEDAPAPRKRTKTLPPPPPGSQERRALEAAILESTTGPAPKSEPVKLADASSKSVPVRAKQPSSPPPLPPAAKSGAHARPPSAARSGPTETGTVDISGMIGGTGAIRLPLRADATAPPLPAPPTGTPARPPPIAQSKPPPITHAKPDDSGEATEVDPTAHLTVPVGEFDHGGTLLDKDKLRVAYEQSTIKRDAASTLLGLPEQPLTVVRAPSVEILLGESAAQITRGDSTGVEPTAKFERGDPTLGPDATTIDPPSAMPSAGGKLRNVAALRRKRGISGDVRYVATAIFGVRRARRELIGLEQQQSVRQKSRARHLLTLGRSAVSSEGYDHPALSKAREQLGVIEDERAQHTAAVAAADGELTRVRTDRADKAKNYAAAIANADAELAEITKKLEPLEKEVSAATRKAAELQESLRRIDAQIAATEASKVSVKKDKVDPAAIQAELASLKADRIAVERDEPRIAADLDALNPRVAALEARRTEARKRRIELEEDEKKDQGRAQELLAAIGAKRIVVDRAAADAEAMRDRILLELGERIYVDRPGSMAFELTPIDAIDVELGSTDRRIMELRELIGSVDKAKLARGIAVIILALAGLGVLAGWLIHIFA